MQSLIEIKGVVGYKAVMSVKIWEFYHLFITMQRTVDFEPETALEACSQVDIVCHQILEIST